MIHNPTGISPKVYRAIVELETGTILSLLQNDLGATVVFTVISQGWYTVTCTGKFTVSKTFLNITAGIADPSNPSGAFVQAQGIDIDTASIQTWGMDGAVWANSPCYYANVEILVYP